jgi:metal-sulfur cluster biosynthetic enzyme
MRLIEGMTVDDQGIARYRFRPSSPFCPLAVFLIAQIKKAVSEVPGIAGQRIQVVGYTAAEELTELINQEV